MFPLYFIGFFVFIFGLCIGSFLNVVIYRLEKGEGFVGGRSYCPHCKHSLMWLDLIPVFSFLFLWGKCRYCGKKISVQYPMVEIATGLIFLLIFNFQFSWPVGASPQVLFNQFSIYQIINILFLWYIASSLIVIFVYDLKFYLILDSVLFPAIIITFLFRLLSSFFIGNWVLGIGNFILAALIASGFFLLIFLISRGAWMGFGDVKLAILLGLLLGFPNILAGLFLSFFFGAIIGLILMLLQKKGLKSEIPFAPFLIAGTLVSMFFGDRIINWYFNFFILP
ncbi:MAG: hypothetical protein A3D44_01720 [Candidatus Staskawiczbacteria bacterium RIFCSPHIGHO2_02_FULL_42_22]|uniref:Prepilin peptidase n=1 Tax=Candidatus Staskawiczbacteria bacterium RIFCSPHIGHO2_02_FULL_42_22 TaxID=1802207 RepID=A0A1G2I116_9BACT|nr:MAG: hypothetical protein A3D44_01720 [Candidatus Staskawiczbacteria bacterium RIFCSPHIGHO2_02_FULL_42_22]